MTPQEEIALLRDALDHIARIANASRQSTRRLDWISSRAREALRGVFWDREYLPEPKKASMDEVHDLRNTIFMLVRTCQTENMQAISAAVEEAKISHPSLFRKRE
ncbi:hypothetical protein ACFO3A_06760 [Comamonas nitrativorans]|uniref:Uncharacterized protein n=1 Tax=Comamonas nitrativorans TaxID=108437 RepID=A0ABV9GV67_9BURK